MRKTTRQILFFFFAGAFLVSAPLVVLYTAGYRLSLNNYRVLETGAIATNTVPRGATVFVDGKKESAKTPTVIQNALPHDTRIRFEKTGYLPWEQTVAVFSRKTTYVTAILFADTKAEVLATYRAGAKVARSENGRYLLVLEQGTNGQITITLFDALARFTRSLGTLEPTEGTYRVTYNKESNLFLITENDLPVRSYTVNGERGDDPSMSAEMPSPVLLIDNGKNIEVRLSRNSEKTLLALLPRHTYRILANDDEYVILADERNIATSIPLSGGSATTLDVPASLFVWHPDLHLFAWSDGIEVNVFDAEAGTRTFITRQSEKILSLAWHPSGAAILIGTGKSITALDREAFANRVSTLIVESDHPIQDLWLDKSGKTLYFLTESAQAVTLERRKLVK